LTDSITWNTIRINPDHLVFPLLKITVAPAIITTSQLSVGHAGGTSIAKYDSGNDSAVAIGSNHL
jgi:hypothetical protein